MTTVNTLKTNSQTYTYEQMQAMMANGTLDSSSIKNVSVFSQSADPSACTDGKDDGKIGFFSAIGSALKGVVKGAINGIKGMFCDENGNFSLGQTLKTVAMGAACMIPGVGPVIAAGLCAYGAVKGAVGIGKGISAAANAKTDAEAKAAFESIGGNALTTGLSIVGLKGSVGAIKSNLNAAKVDTSSLSSIKNGITKAEGVEASTFTGKLTNVANNLTGNYYQGTWSGAASSLEGFKAVVKKGAVGTGENIVATAKAVGDKFNTHKVKNEAQAAKKMSIDKKAIHEASNGDIIAGKDGNMYRINKGTNGELSYTKVKSELTYTKAGSSEGQVTLKDSGLEGENLEALKGMKNGESQTIDGTTYTKTGGRKGSDGATFKTETTTPATKTTTTAETFKAMKDKQIELTGGKTVELGDVLKKPGSSKTAADGTIYSNVNGSVTITKTSNISNFGYETGTFVQDASFQIRSLSPKTAAFAVTSNAVGNASDDMLNAVPYMSQTYATVDTQTGRYYELQDYSLPTDIDQKYSQIMNQAYVH